VSDFQFMTKYFWLGTNQLSCYDVFGYTVNNRITTIFIIEIVAAHPNTNLLFRNSKNSCILLFLVENEIVAIILNFP
jgi:hypothetical protein